MRYLITFLVLGALIPCGYFVSSSDEQTIRENDFLPHRYRNLDYYTLPQGAFTDTQLKDGAFLLYIVGIIYVFAAIYIIHKKYFYPLLEDLFEQVMNQVEFYRPVLYAFFNSLLIGFVCFYANLISGTHLGTNAALGMDAMNFFVIVGYTLARRIDEQNLDRWEFARDDVFYLIGLGLVCTFGSLGQLQWWMGFVIIIYFVLYMIVRRKDEKLKDSIYRALGLIHDDDGFNVSNNFRQQRRRVSVSDIVPEFINDSAKNDAALKKKIHRIEGIIKLNESTNSKITSENVQHWIKWHSITTMIIHGIKKRNDKLKMARAEKYKEELENTRRRNRVQNEDSDEDSETSRNIVELEKNEDQPNTGENGSIVTPRMKDSGEEKNEGSKLIDEGEAKPKEEEEHKEPEEHQENGKIHDESQNEEKPEAHGHSEHQEDQDSPERDSQKDVSPQDNQFTLGRKETDKVSELGKQNEDNFSPRGVSSDKLVDNRQSAFYVENDDDDYKEEDYNLSFPRGFWNIVSYFVFFPINLITYFTIPNFRKEGGQNKVLLALIITFIILGGLSFLELWWFEKVAFATNANSEMLGSCFASIGFSIPFIVYNVKLYNDRGDEHVLYTAFRQVGIFRIGICIGWSWMIGSAVTSDSANDNLPLGGVSVSYYVLAGLVLLNMICVVIKKCKIPSKFSYLCFIFYVVWWVSNFVLCQFYPDFSSLPPPT